MLNSLPLRSKSPALVPATSVGTPQAGQVPSIRLITATPSATGLSSEASTSFNRSLEESWATMPSIPSSLAPKTDNDARRRLVPKKSKLSILGMGGGRDKKEDRAKDLSDVVRRLGVNEGDYSSGRGGFEIYVDPTVDPDIGDIVMVKKKKSRVALNGMAWGAMGEVTNIPKAKEVKENPGLLKVKSDEEKKWWSIGRGRKDSKEKKEKENKISHKPVEYIHNPPRSKTPEPFHPSQDTRARFNSFDSGVILNGGATKSLSPGALPVETPAQSFRGVPTFQPGPSRIIPMPADDDDERPDLATHSRSTTPTFGGLLAPPGANGENTGSGSIALRAIRSVRSLARMGSWAQLKNMPAPSADEEMSNGTVKKKKKDEAPKEKGSKKKKAKENAASEEGTDGKKKSTKKKSTKKEKEAEKPQPARQSSSSFEIGALSASPGAPREAIRTSLSPSESKTLGPKKASTLLGIGLPSTMRLPSVRSGSTASSNYGVPLNNNDAPPPATISNNRLSVESAQRPASSLSSGSSLRPMSTTSTNSRLSSGSSAASVRWDEQGLETVREQRKKEREVKARSKELESAAAGDDEKKERRTSRESKHSIEGRRRTALSAVFPEVRQAFDEVEIGKEMVKDMMDVDEQEQEQELEVGMHCEEEEEEALRRWSYPILTIEEATSDGHGRPDSYDEFIAHYEESEEGSHEGMDQEDDQPKPDATPVRKARARPLSEQLLGRSRPKPMYEDEEGVLSILDAATNDLAMLIKTLDLQATPSTPDMTPLRPSASASPSPTPVSTLEKAGVKGSPKRKNVTESPLSAKSNKKKDLFRQISTSSINSIRPYAQSRGYPPKPTTTSGNIASSARNNAGNAALISKQIAPWATLMKGLSPVKEKSSSLTKTLSKASSPPSTIAFRPGHKRTMTPAPEPEPEPVLQPLRPAQSRLAVKAKLLKAQKSPEPEKEQGYLGVDDEDLPRAPASLTFGRSSSRGTVRLSQASEEYTGSLTPVFQRIQNYERKTSLSPSENLLGSRSSRGSRSSKGSRSSYGSQIQNPSDVIPMSRETRRVLGLSGTMGGSDVSCYRDSEPLDVSDPDSDVPDELRHILATTTNSPRASVAEDDEDMEDLDVSLDTNMDMEEAEIEIARSARSYTPVLPPTLPLNIPKFKAELVDDHDNHFDIDDYPASPTSEEDTKKSFDFTGELQKLNESGGSDRRSFVEQLENAFRTPAKIDLRYDFGVDPLKVEVPPVPELPLSLRMAIEAENSGTSNENGSSEFDGLDSQSQLVNMKFPSVVVRNDTISHQDTKSNIESKSQFDMFTASRIVDVKEPTMFEGADSLDNSDSNDILAKRKLTSSTSSNTSEGELNTSFRFGGLPRSESSASLPNADKPLTLSDIIPPPSHARSISGIDSFNLDGIEDDSVLRSIYGHMVNDLVQPRPRVSSDSSVDQSALEKRRSIYKASSRPTSGISFVGIPGFDEVRRTFEFHNERPGFYPPEANKSNASRRVQHQRYESNFSIASVSSYGHVTKAGSADPFDFGIPVLPSLQERPSSENLSQITYSFLDGDVEDTFAFRPGAKAPPRRRVGSDASSFYFRPMQQNGIRGHRRRESNMSVSSQAPPISLYNRSFGHHRRNDSSASTSSVAMSYVKHGANGGISAWARHRKDQSVDSVMSDFSAMHLGRPGIGDKMFDHQGDHGPLTSITASPPESASASQQHFARRASFDSIMDEEHRTSIEDSLFEQTGYRSSESDSAVFGGDDFARQYRSGLLQPVQYRPVSLLVQKPEVEHKAIKDDDTMISMLGGGHVRRCSVGSIVEASPCVRVEKRKHSAVQPAHMTKGHNQYESPNKARIVEKPSIASTSSFQFGGERMIRAQRGLLERQSLEEHVLTAEGEDLSVSYHAIPVFSRPGPATRSRSSTCTSSSGGDTPPLSASDGSSISEGSQSSIDLSQINIALSNATHPISSVARNRVRARARGTGHRRRYSKSHISRSSVYETIEEEMHSNQTSPAHSLPSKKDDSPTTTQGVFIVDSDTASLSSKPEESVWDDERGIVALRKYYALRDEAQTTVTESRKLWMDTPFSLYALQSFQAPGSPAGMQALLEHSVQNYGPLPSELRRHRRTRTSSRPSPYPQARTSKANLSPEKKRSTNMDNQRTPTVLQNLPVNVHTGKSKGKKASDAPSLGDFKPFSPLSIDVVEPKQENAFGLAAGARPRVGSSARRTALGWSKRSNGPKSSTEQKENSIVITTPGDNLRLNRPRPRGRPTPGGRTPAASANRPPMPTSTNRAIRI